MLSSMRGGKNQTVVWILLGLLILGLTGFGIGGLGGGTIRSVGTVGDQPVSIDIYARSLQNAVQNASRQVGRNLSPSEIEALGLPQQVLASVVASSALDNEAAELGISVGDEIVARDIRATPAFQGLDGNFDKEAYDFALERAGVSAKENEDLIRQTAARNLMQAAVATGNTGSADQARILLNFAREARDFTWVAIGADQLTESLPEPSDADLQAQYEETPGLYTTPEARNITYVWLTPTMLEDQVSVDEAQLRESYELQSERFNRAPQIDVDRIVFSDQAEAQAAMDRIAAGEVDFDAVLSERNLDAADAALGTLGASGLSAAAGELLFAQDTPGVYGPAESSLGPALYRVNAFIAAQATSFEEARKELFAELAGEDARRMVNDLVDEIDDLMAAGATLEELAQDTDMQLGTIKLVPDSTDEIAGYGAFRQAAAAANVGDFPEISELSDGGIFALRLDSISEPALQPLADVKDAVVSDWTAAETLRQLETRAAEIKDQILAGTDINSLGLNAQNSAGVTRDTFLESVPLNLVTDVFELEAENMVAQTTGETQVYLAQLTSIAPFDPIEPSNASLLEQVNAQLSSARSADMLNLFAQGLQEKAGVSLNQAAINSVNYQIFSSP